MRKHASRLFVAFALAVLSNLAWSKDAANPSCEEINAEANRLHGLARSRASGAEVLSYLLAPSNAATLHDQRKRDQYSAWTNLYELMEFAQLRSCDVVLRSWEIPLDNQKPAVQLGSKTLECVKPNGVRVYAAERVKPEHISEWRVSVYSMPPKGPSIVLYSGIPQDMPEIVAVFMYERACEAHRQGFRLWPDRDYHANLLRHNCTAIRNLKVRGWLTDAHFSTLQDYMAKHERSLSSYYTSPADKSRIRQDEAFARCYSSDEFSP